MSLIDTDVLEATQKEFPYLRRCQPGESPYFLASYNIRRELRHVFPCTSFRVQSGVVFPEALRRELQTYRPDIKYKRVAKTARYAHKVIITWAGDPSRAQVLELLSKYEMGHFSCETRTYIYEEPQAFHQLFGAVEYIFPKRLPAEASGRPTRIKEFEVSVTRKVIIRKTYRVKALSAQAATIQARKQARKDFGKANDTVYKAVLIKNQEKDLTSNAAIEGSPDTEAPRLNEATLSPP